MELEPKGYSLSHILILMIGSWLSHLSLFAGGVLRRSGYYLNSGLSYNRNLKMWYKFFNQIFTSD